jgi:hypothetical protein
MTGLEDFRKPVGASRHPALPRTNDMLESLQYIKTMTDFHEYLGRGRGRGRSMKFCLENDRMTQ